MSREQLTAIVRLLTGIGIVLLMLVFVRACFSPPPLPKTPMPTDSGGNNDTLEHGTRPPMY